MFKSGALIRPEAAVEPTPVAELTAAAATADASDVDSPVWLRTDRRKNRKIENKKILVVKLTKMYFHTIRI